MPLLLQLSEVLLGSLHHFGSVAWCLLLLELRVLKDVQILGMRIVAGAIRSAEGEVASTEGQAGAAVLVVWQIFLSSGKQSLIINIIRVRHGQARILSIPGRHRVFLNNWAFLTLIIALQHGLGHHCRVGVV